MGTLKIPDPLWGKRSFYQPSRGLPPSLSFKPWAFLMPSTPPSLPPIQRSLTQAYLPPGHRLKAGAQIGKQAQSCDGKQAQSCDGCGDKRNWEVERWLPLLRGEMQKEGKASIEFRRAPGA